MYLDRTTGKLNYEVANNSENSWTQIANSRGQNGSWNTEAYYIESSVVYGSDLIVGTTYTSGSADVWRRSGSNWSRIGGDGLNGSWSNFTYEGVYSLAINGDALYAGLGSNAGDAEVWTCSLASSCAAWTKVGGDNTGLTTSHETVRSMTIHQGSLYVGAGDGAGDGDVYKYNGGTSWTQIGGDALNSGWASGTYERVQSITSDGTYLYAGLATTAGDAEVWRWNGTAWTKIGGDAVNSSWADATYEYVYSMTAYGGNLYAGLAITAGDAEVWRWDGTTWTKIGGDAVNSSWADATYECVCSLVNDGTNLYAGLGSGSGDGEIYKWNGTTWTKIGGDNLNSGFGGTAAGIYSMVYDTANSKLYAGVQSSYGAYAWEFNGTTWTLIGGASLNGSWSHFTASNVMSMTSHNGKMYIGLGSGVGSAVVYEYDGTNYTAIGGNGTKSSWAYGNDGTYETVQSLISYNGQLYAGLGTSAGDGEVWRYNGSTWSQVGGDSVNSSWSTSQYVNDMAVWNGKLYATTYSGGSNGYVYEFNGTSWTNRGGGTGNVNGITNGAYSGAFSLVPYNDRLCMGFGQNTNMADVWCWTGSGNWSQIGGDGVNSSWNSSAIIIQRLATYNGMLVAGTSDDTNRDPAVWVYNGTSWTKIGGGGINGSWSDVVYYRVFSFAVYNGELYTGLGYGGNNGHIWKWNGTTWAQVAGDSLNGTWNTSIETARSLNVYKGKLYAGLGDSSTNDAQVYVLGNNAVVESTTTSFSANWTHIAGTYDGATAKLYINGSQVGSTTASATQVDNSLPLLIGTSYGDGKQGDGLGRFAGSLDEMRFSNSTRTSFTTKPYSSSAQGVVLSDAVRESGVASWDGFASSETTDGGSIAYRLSDDGGVTWKYWTGSVWDESSTLGDSNSVSVVNSNINSFPVGFGGITWQAVLQGNGDQRVQLNDVTLTANSDTNAPDTNATNIHGNKASGGSVLASNDWTNGASPSFDWDPATDNGAGMLGYCLYLGQTPTADPVTTKGLLGTSPLNTAGNCQFAIAGTNLNLATSGLLQTALTTSSTPYYLNIKAIDKAGNTTSNSEQFQFRFDNTAPTNPGFISAPSNFVNNKTVTMTWPTSGGNAPSDGHSGLAGLQYRIGNSSWYGDAHSGSGDSGDLLANDGSYTTVDPPDFDNMTDGVNTVSFRTWDQAGNVTTSYVSAAIRVNTSGAPSEPQNLAVSPATNTANSFAFSWTAPATFNTTTGDSDKLSYCYTVNTLPTVSNCSFTDQGETTLAAGAYATQPGANTFYVVAKDDFNAINYSSFASTTFTANTAAPGMPINVDVADVSVKATGNWRLAITWDQPVSVGAGVTQYRVYRSSTVGGVYAQVGTSSSTSYIDVNLSQNEYFYKVKACDSANNCGAESSIVLETPTGKFTVPAVLTSDPTVGGITTKRAEISWSTDRSSSSRIMLSTTSGQYGQSEVGSSSQVTSHKVGLDNLAAGTTYYYKALWTDEDGNTGQSQEFVFKTAPAPVLKEVNTISVGLFGATIQFTTKDAVKVDLNFGRNDSFGGIKSINTSSSESVYTIALDGLDDGSKYLYQISLYDSEGGKYPSSLFSFNTPPRPQIADLRFQPVKGEPTSTQRVTWRTNVPTTTTLDYGKMSRSALTIQQSELKTDHEVTLRGLEDDSEYYLLAQGRDANGNLATSDKQVFKTALDTRPPGISDIVIEASIKGTGPEARGQIIVSWTTDEPSTSQVAFAEGSNVKEFNSKTAEDGSLTLEHLVVVSDLPTSKVYSIAPISKDRSNNTTTAETQSAIIGRASDNILSLVLMTLQKAFRL